MGQGLTRRRDSRRFNAVQSDIDRVLPDLRVAYQELIYLAKLQ
jgi:hypothetical protein